jgi:hypothetical protein
MMNNFRLSVGLAAALGFLSILLAVAAGGVAVPQAGEGDIICAG